MNGYSFAHTSGKPSLHDHHVYLSRPKSALVICLLSTDLIQGLSGIMTLVWVRNGQVSSGTICTAQAVLLHIGDVGTAFWNAIIAGHTFWTVVLGKTSPGPIIAVSSQLLFL
jgi:hypothetical protein